MSVLSCPFHSGEDCAGVFISVEVGYRHECTRTDGHPEPGPFVWVQPPEAPDLPEVTGLAVELGLDVDLPAVLAGFEGQWVEYGVVERAYAIANPDAFAVLVDRYGHTAANPEGVKYSASSFIAGTLGVLQRRGEVAQRMGPATGRWHYNGEVSWLSLTPSPPWGQGLSWAETGCSMDYVPGNVEK